MQEVCVRERRCREAREGDSRGEGERNGKEGERESERHYFCRVSQEYFEF